MRVLVCLIMAAITLNMSAFAGEVWVLDLDAGPVVVNEDGTTEPWEPDFALINEEPAVDPADEPAAEDPVSSSTEEPSASEPVSDPAEEPSAEEPVSDPVEEITMEESEENEVFLMEVVEEDPGITPYTVSELNEPESSGSLDPENQTMKDAVVMVLGEYSPRTQTVTQYLSDGSSESYTEIVPGVAGMDWEWISGAALFALVLFSFFKFVGVLLRNG